MYTHINIYIYLAMRETFSMKGVLNYCIDLYYNGNGLSLYFLFDLEYSLHYFSSE